MDLWNTLYIQQVHSQAYHCSWCHIQYICLLPSSCMPPQHLVRYQAWQSSFLNHLGVVLEQITGLLCTCTPTEHPSIASPIPDTRDYSGPLRATALPQIIQYLSMALHSNSGLTVTRTHTATSHTWYWLPLPLGPCSDRRRSTLSVFCSVQCSVQSVSFWKSLVNLNNQLAEKHPTGFHISCSMLPVLTVWERQQPPIQSLMGDYSRRSPMTCWSRCLSAQQVCWVHV